jgi:hypothetical protein
MIAEYAGGPDIRKHYVVGLLLFRAFGQHEAIEVRENGTRRNSS